MFHSCYPLKSLAMLINCISIEYHTGYVRASLMSMRQLIPWMNSFLFSISISLNLSPYSLSNNIYFTSSWTSMEFSINLLYSTCHPSLMPCYVRWPLVMMKSVFTLLLFYLYWLAIMQCWFNDLQMESNEGSMTLRVEKTICNGFKMFLISETMMFLSLIVSFICSVIAYINMWVMMIFPSRGMVTIFPLGLPLGNVLMLIKSSLPLQASLMWIKKGYKSYMIKGMANNMACTGFFIFMQLKEYTTALFTMSDSMYGTNFYCVTGLHGLHMVFAMMTNLIVNEVVAFSVLIVIYINHPSMCVDIL